MCTLTCIQTIRIYVITSFLMVTPNDIFRSIKLKLFLKVIKKSYLKPYETKRNTKITFSKSLALEISGLHYFLSLTRRLSYSHQHIILQRSLCHWDWRANRDRLDRWGHLWPGKRSEFCWNMWQIKRF